MKVYIITSGEYSDYGIDKVFIDKEKAEEWIRLNQRRYDVPKIEEWNTSDESFIIGKYQIKKYITVNYESESFNGGEGFQIYLSQDNTESRPNLNEYPYNYSNYSYRTWNRTSHTISLYRLVDDDFTEEDLKSVSNKYLKICRDYVTKAKSLMSEGFDEKQIKEMLFEQ
jgi:hypothetical protein